MNVTFPELPVTKIQDDAPSMNGLVNAGRPGRNNARNSLRCELSLGTSDTCRWETATDAQVAVYPG